MVALIQVRLPPLLFQIDKFNVFSASKHAVEGLSKSLRQELYPWNIFVCNVNPGFMK
jgi:NAD(P)-dependent dehydrogenase (short-subunit alcohol dehydrogenase family)